MSRCSAKGSQGVGSCLLSAARTGGTFAAGSRGSGLREQSHCRSAHLASLHRVFPTCRPEVARTMSSIGKHPEKPTKEGREVREG